MLLALSLALSGEREWPQWQATTQWSPDLPGHLLLVIPHVELGE
jgi:hypothetical protein